MFGFLKKTLEKAVGVFKKKVEVEAEEAPKIEEEVVVETPKVQAQPKVPIKDEKKHVDVVKDVKREEIKKEESKIDTKKEEVKKVETKKEEYKKEEAKKSVHSHEKVEVKKPEVKIDSKSETKIDSRKADEVRKRAAFEREQAERKLEEQRILERKREERKESEREAQLQREEEKKEAERLAIEKRTLERKAEEQRERDRKEAERLALERKQLEKKELEVTKLDKKEQEKLLLEKRALERKEAELKAHEKKETERRAWERKEAERLAELEARRKKPVVIEKTVEEEKEEPKKRGFFSFFSEKITKFKLSPEKFDEMFWELEVALLENNVAVEVIEKIKDDLKRELTGDAIPRGNVEERIARTLKKSIEELFDVETFDLIQRVKTKKPFIIAMIGVNGSGKTTTLAKLIHLFQKNNLSVVVAASDTFRAAAIQQLEEHTTKLGVKLIKNDYKSDPAAIAYDAVEHAKSKGLDIVLIDTAGRLHSNTNLMDELKKVIRVAKPDLKIFIGESITGNDCVEQAKEFDSAVGIDAIILAKADVDEKGGAAVSVSYVTKRPILYLGTGQTYDDLVKFDEKIILDGLGL